MLPLSDASLRGARRLIHKSDLEYPDKDIQGVVEEIKYIGSMYIVMNCSKYRCIINVHESKVRSPYFPHLSLVMTGMSMIMTLA